MKVIKCSIEHSAQSNTYLAAIAFYAGQQNFLYEEYALQIT